MDLEKWLPDFNKGTYNETGVVPLFTAIISSCPLYSLAGIKTTSVSRK
jgi:hypothetical protein